MSLKEAPLALPHALSMDSLYLGDAGMFIIARSTDGMKIKEDSRYTEQAKEDRKEYTSYANITGSDECI